MDISIDEALIKKETLHAGSKFVKFVNGTKVTFHYQTRKCDDNRTIVDDSKKINKPMVLILGKKFKLEVWEVIVQKMALNEVAKFTCDKSLVLQYPFVSKTIRDSMKQKEERRHCCGMTMQNEGIGYSDLDELFNNPCDLEFIIEILNIENPDQYEKESWQLNDEEKMHQIQDLKEKGNAYYKEKNIQAAQDCYATAIGMIEQLMLKEKPKDTEWLELSDLKIPLLLNYSQCKLIEKDYYAVIEHCSEVLKYDENNLKALYRRAKAHVGAWNPEQAKHDYQRCMELDPNLQITITKELNQLQEAIKMHELEDKMRFQKMF
uniref:Putative ah receptor-interacting protein n=1 Tax=Corethrella appendiculata TaxID=1370023 RepID=U5EJP9_9DIPT